LAIAKVRHEVFVNDTYVLLVHAFASAIVQFLLHALLGMLCDVLEAASVDGEVIASAFFRRIVELEGYLARIIQFVLASALSVPATSL